MEWYKDFLITCGALIKGETSLKGKIKGKLMEDLFARFRICGLSGKFYGMMSFKGRTKNIKNFKKISMNSKD